MKRTGIALQSGRVSVVLEFDEEYKAGSMAPFVSHYREAFQAHGGIVKHKTTISGIKAPGVMGFFYKHLGSGNIGRAVLASHKGYLESLD